MMIKRTTKAFFTALLGAALLAGTPSKSVAQEDQVGALVAELQALSDSMRKSSDPIFQLPIIGRQVRIIEYLQGIKPTPDIATSFAGRKRRAETRREVLAKQVLAEVKELARTDPDTVARDDFLAVVVRVVSGIDALLTSGTSIGMDVDMDLELGQVRREMLKAATVPGQPDPPEIIPYRIPPPSDLLYAWRGGRPISPPPVTSAPFWDETTTAPVVPQESNDALSVGPDDPPGGTRRGTRRHMRSIDTSRAEASPFGDRTGAMGHIRRAMSNILTASLVLVVGVVVFNICLGMLAIVRKLAHAYERPHKGISPSEEGGAGDAVNRAMEGKDRPEG